MRSQVKNTLQSKCRRTYVYAKILFNLNKIKMLFYLLFQDEWLNCQRAWLYLESIFSAPDIQRQLPAEAKMFMQVDKSYKDIMRKVNKVPSAIRAGTQPGKFNLKGTITYKKMSSGTCYVLGWIFFYSFTNKSFHQTLNRSSNYIEGENKFYFPEYFSHFTCCSI